jgi:hypothetical protein
MLQNMVALTASSNGILDNQAIADAAKKFNVYEVSTIALLPLRVPKLTCSSGRHAGPPSHL